MFRRLFFSLVLLAGCKGGSAEPPGAPPSPQATAEPAPFANPPTTATASADAGPSPEWLRTDQAVAADVPHESVVHDAGREWARDTREVAGYSIEAVVRTGEGPPAPKALEVNVSAIEAMKRHAESRIAIEVTPTRARFVITGGGFVLPAGTELRARHDRYGHLLLWPGEDTYRVAEAGSLRALFGERRLDVAPTARADAVDLGEGPARLNMRTRRVGVSTRAAKATVELATLRDADDGGTLVCRLLLDLMSASPSTAACGTDEMPLHAELQWTTRGTFVFDVVSLVRRPDLNSQDLAAPPASLAFVASPPPQLPTELMVPKAELTTFRTAPVDVPPPTQHEPHVDPDPDGLTLLNSTDELRVAWLDGVPVAWLAPGARLVIPSLLRGRYTLQWRTFLGDSWEAPMLTVVPGVSEIGAKGAALP